MKPALNIDIKRIKFSRSIGPCFYFTQDASKHSSLLQCNILCDSLIWLLPKYSWTSKLDAHKHDNTFNRQSLIYLQWIMGLGSIHWAWQRQTKDFGHDQAAKYTCLVFDNRGIGESDKPLLRYSTSEMAKDTLELLDHLGWTNERQLHVIGSSLGGMIAQELVTLCRPSAWKLFRFFLK